MEKNNSKNFALCIICGILTFFGAVANIYSLVNGGFGRWMINDVASLTMIALIGYYAISGYRKPHGNLLKYIILISTLPRFIAVYQMAQLNLPWHVVIRAVIVGLCCYVAGRLHKVRQNIILMSIVAVLRLIGIVDAFAGNYMTVGAITPLIIWFDIFVAYVLRYREHKEAGLMDAK